MSYIYFTYMTKDLFSEYVNNSFNSIIMRQTSNKMNIRHYTHTKTIWIAGWHLKKCPTSSITRTMQISVAMWYLYGPSRITERWTPPNLAEDVEPLALSYMIDACVNWYSYLRSLSTLHKIQHIPTHDPAILLLGIYPRKVKTYVFK